MPDDPLDLLPARMDFDGNDHDAVIGELVEQRLRDLLGGLSDDDPFERGLLRPAPGAVTSDGGDVVKMKHPEPLLGAAQERAKALDRIDPPGKAAQNRGLIARAGADLEHL